jgi:hypothetical protein
METPGGKAVVGNVHVATVASLLRPTAPMARAEYQNRVGNPGNNVVRGVVFFFAICPWFNNGGIENLWTCNSPYYLPAVPGDGVKEAEQYRIALSAHIAFATGLTTTEPGPLG